MSQEVGGTLIGEDGLVVMAGAESVEWYQIIKHMVTIYSVPAIFMSRPPLSVWYSTSQKFGHTFSFKGF